VARVGLRSGHVRVHRPPRRPARARGLYEHEGPTGQEGTPTETGEHDALGNLSGAHNASTLTITLDNSTEAETFGTGAQVIVIDRERILCDSRSGVVFTVNAAGRGWQRTTAASHSSGAEVTYP
jgi:hypothetical protein